MENSTISFAFIISVVSVVCVLFNTIASGKKRQQEMFDVEKNRQIEMEKQFTKLNVKLDSFSISMDELVRKNDKTSDEVRKISDRLIEDRIKIEDHEKRLIELERGA